MVLIMFSDATMANLQDDSPDLHIADAPRARAIGIRASGRIIAPRGRSQDPGFFQLQAFVRHSLRPWPMTELLLYLLTI
jgi:hypothetical protein